MIWAGPTPSEEGLPRCHEVLLRADGDKKTMASALTAQAAFEAGLGSFEKARRSLARAYDLLDEVALTVWMAGPYAQAAGWVELLAGDTAAAERVLRAGFDTLRKIGEMSWFSTVAGLLAEAVLQAGRREEAEALAEASRAAAAPDDVYSQVVWRTVASTVHASERASGERRKGSPGRPWTWFAGATSCTCTGTPSWTSRACWSSSTASRTPPRQPTRRQRSPGSKAAWWPNAVRWRPRPG